MIDYVVEGQDHDGKHIKIDGFMSERAAQRALAHEVGVGIELYLNSVENLRNGRDHIIVIEAHQGAGLGLRAFERCTDRPCPYGRDTVEIVNLWVYGIKTP
jgi:hypothetical protein